MSAEPPAGSRAVLIPEATLQEQILSVAASWQTAQYALVKLVAELDATDGWAGCGASTCAHWVADALDIEVSTAREWIRVGRALEDLPLIDASFESGLSYSKARTLTRVATRDSEEDLLALAWDTPAGRLGTVLAHWLMHHEAPEETARRQHAARAISWRTEPDGMIHGEFRLPPAMGKRLTAGIDAIVRRGRPRRSMDASADAWEGPWPSVAQQRADALLQLLTEGGTRFVTELLIHVRGDGAAYDDGTPIPWAELERIAPETFVRALIHDADRRPINASARRRHPSARQRRVVSARDRGCVDCGSTELLEFDHSPAFEETGHTVVNELELRCWPCHHRRTLEAARARGRRLRRS